MAAPRILRNETAVVHWDAPLPCQKAKKVVKGKIVSPACEGGLVPFDETKARTDPDYKVFCQKCGTPHMFGPANALGLSYGIPLSADEGK
jgi:hypothetical protein